MKITIEIPESDAIFLKQFVMSRVTSHAVAMLCDLQVGDMPNGGAGVIDNCIEDLTEMSPVIRRLQQEIVKEIHNVEARTSNPT